MAELYDITIDQGADWEFDITWQDSAGNPVNLTGYAARLQLRLDYDSASPALDLSTSNGKITLGGAAGTITIKASNTQTAALTEPRYFYDLELTSSGGIVTRLIGGRANIVPEVTR